MTKASEIREFADVGERIRWHRNYKKMTQAQYAKTLSISRSRLSNWELGTRRPSLTEGMQMEKLHGLSLDFLYRGKDGNLPQDLFEAWRAQLHQLSN